jgi:hypothetical protein
MISPLGTALASGFKSVSGLDSETELVEHSAHPSAAIVTNNKDDSGRYLMESEGIGFDLKSDTRPLAEGLIAYNGHAGLGGHAVPFQIEPAQIEFPNT